MLMTPTDVLDDIIARLDPEDVPVEFIVMAKITDFQGAERIVKGQELLHLMKHPDQYQIAEARVILNVKKIRKAIMAEVSYFYDEVNRLFMLTDDDDDDGSDC
jgi:hypothetical protein